MAPRQDRRLIKEQLPMRRQHPKHADAGVLVHESFDPLDRLVQRPRHRVYGGEGQPWIRPGQDADIGTSPLPDYAVGQGHELDRRRNGGESGPAEEHAGRRDAADQLRAVLGRSSRGTVALEDEGQWHGFTLSIEVLALADRTRPHGINQHVDGMRPAARQGRYQEPAECRMLAA